jgi:hypothetical protein
MDAPDQPDDVLKLIAVSATELADAIQEGDMSEVSEMIARVLDDRQAA